MKFSQKIGKIPVREALQVDSMDDRLVTQLWNVMWNSFFYWIANNDGFHSKKADAYCIMFWSNFLNKTVDTIPRYHQNKFMRRIAVLNALKEWYFKNKWYHKYDLVEFISKKLDDSIFDDECNIILKKEMSGYRLIENSITPITSEKEIIEIERAFNHSSKWDSVKEHLNVSLSHLSNRSEPDYTNSLKESISAVESTCLIILGEKKDGLKKYLAAIKNRFGLNGALESAFKALYGHASNNARHGRGENSEEITMPYARFMLISCSAFVNYLIELELEHLNT